MNIFLANNFPPSLIINIIFSINFFRIHGLVFKFIFYYIFNYLSLSSLERDEHKTTVMLGCPGKVLEERF